MQRAKLPEQQRIVDRSNVRSADVSLAIKNFSGENASLYVQIFVWKMSNK